MPDSGMAICENDIKQPDSTISERSPTRPAEDKDRKDPAVQVPLTVAPTFPVKPP